MDAIRRLSVLAHHMATPQNEVVICAAFRTPVTKANDGELKDVSLESLLSPVLKKIISTTGINPSKIDEIVIGNVLDEGSAIAAARMAQMMAGIPDTTSLNTVNRLSSSSLEACSVIVNQIKADEIEVGIAGGFEKISSIHRNQWISPKPVVTKHESALDHAEPMSSRSDSLVRNFEISRMEQIRLVVESHAKARFAQEMKLFDAEIAPVEATVMVDGKPKKTIVSKDGIIRKDTSYNTFAESSPTNEEYCGTTANIITQVCDGAAAILFASWAAAKKYNLPIIARWVGFAAIGVSPKDMSTSPAVAIPKVLQQTGLQISDIDIFELSEDLGIQLSYCIETLGILKEKVSPKGGSLALGYTFACTGAVLISTLIPELKRTKKRYGLVSMGVLTGMGVAAIIENISE